MMASSTMTGINSPELREIADRFWSWRMRDVPEFAHVCGVHQPDILDERSLQSFAERERMLRAFDEELKAYKDTDSFKALNSSDSLTYRLLSKAVADCLYGYRFRAWLMPVSLLEGPQVDLPNLIPALSFDTEADYNSYINKLRAVPRQMDQNISLMRQGMAEGRVPPRPVLHGVPEQLASFANPADPKELVFYRPFKNMPDSMSVDAKAKLEDLGLAVINECVVPAFKQLRDFVINEYTPAAREDIACTALPDGEEHYRQCLRVHTSTNMTAEEIHNLGKREVQRIRQEMDDVIKRVGFQGDFAAFTEHLRSNPQFYAKSEEELLDGYRAICKSIDARLPGKFKTLYNTPYMVAATPPHQAPQAPSAYWLGTATGGTFYVNTHKLDSRPMYEMEALALHEAIPGHHFQGCVAMETDLPPFRRFFEDRRYFEFPSRFSFETAYLEGWGLYSESMGEELGLYTDPYQKFGALSLEIWRALRLVVDTGMHALGWSEVQAADYMEENSGLSRVNIENEVRRYIAVPGQACAYKIGQIEIRRLRNKAQAELGDAFDVREFHDVVLVNGPVPMTVLEELVNEYIAAKQKV